MNRQTLHLFFFLTESKLQSTFKSTSNSQFKLHNHPLACSSQSADPGISDSVSLGGPMTSISKTHDISTAGLKRTPLKPVFKGSSQCHSLSTLIAPEYRTVGLFLAFFFLLFFPHGTPEQFNMDSVLTIFPYNVSSQFNIWTSHFLTNFQCHNWLLPRHMPAHNNN